MDDFRRLVFILFLALASCSSSFSETTLTCDLVQHKHALSCDAGLIVVHNVTLSHRDAEVCVDGVRPTVVKPPACSTAPLLDFLRSKCDGRYRCDVSIDRCHASCLRRCVWMETSYSCQPGRIHHDCQKHNAVLHCGSQLIKVLMADYGRTSRSVCSYDYWQPPDTDCIYNARRTVAVRCDGQHRCSVPVSNQLFFNMCFGTRKYLQYSYLCVDR